MTFKIGDRVTMLRTGKTGTISALLKGDMYQVRLDGGLGHLPAPSHAIAPAGAAGSAAQPAPDPPSDRRPEPSQKDEHDTGIQLAFDPLYGGEGEPESYQLYLINGTGSQILYEIKVKTGDHQRSSKFGPLEAYGKKRLDVIPYGWLNERLGVDLDVRAKVEGGTGPRHYHQLRIRPKQFFGSFREVPELSRGAHLFTVFPRLAATSVAEKSSSGPTLRELTRAQLKKQPEKKAPARPPASPLQARSDFNPVLDLHLEALVEDPAAVPKDKVLSTQMEHFDHFIDQALRLDIERVYIVHGLGNGILKTEIHTKLQHVPFVQKFSNDYHPKYGYGATEVVFEAG